MLDPQAAVESLLEIDRATGPAATVTAAREGERPARPADRRVVGHPAGIVEAEDGRGGEAVGERPPGGLGIGGRDGEPLVVARQVAGEDGVGLLDRRGAGQPELADEPILERAPQALDPALRLRAAGADPADARRVEGPPDLGEAVLAGELLGERRRSVLLDDEDLSADRSRRRPADRTDPPSGRAS